jgi:hypothetical protein
MQSSSQLFSYGCSVVLCHFAVRSVNLYGARRPFSLPSVRRALWILERPRRFLQPSSSLWCCQWGKPRTRLSDTLWLQNIVIGAPNVRLWTLYRVSQEERSVFWEIKISAILRKMFIWTFVLLRTVSEIQPFDCRVVWLGRSVLPFPPAMLHHCLKHVTLCEAVYIQMALSRKPFGIGHMFVSSFFFA